jgi:hypothetical protein
MQPKPAFYGILDAARAIKERQTRPLNADLPRSIGCV